MIHLYFIGDGERDGAAVPPIVAGLLNAQFDVTTDSWKDKRLHGRGKGATKGLKGVGRKMLYALRRARNRGADGVVATADRDKTTGRTRLKKLQEARARDRAKLPALPTAVGVAIPHQEAWLLDDPAAVREALELPPSTDVPSVSKVDYPKTTLETLLENSPRAAEKPLVVWADIAGCLDARRCRQGKRTGFQAFVEDVRNEIGPLFATDGGRD